MATAAEPAVTEPEPRRDPGWLRRWWVWWTVLAGVLLLVGFGVPEAIAIIDPGKGGTYTESLQDWLGTSDGGTGWGWWALAGVLVVFVAWFIPHVKGGIWPWERRRDEERDAPDG